MRGAICAIFMTMFASVVHRTIGTAPALCGSARLCRARRSGSKFCQPAFRHAAPRSRMFTADRSSTASYGRGLRRPLGRSLRCRRSAILLHKDRRLHGLYPLASVHQ